MIGDQFFDHFADVGVDTDRLFHDLIGTEALAEVHADVGRILIICRQPPKRILDDDRGVAADSEFKIHDVLVPVYFDEIVVPLCRFVPTLVLDEFVVGAQVHGHRLAADGTARDQLGRDLHILLPFDHCDDRVLVVVGFVMARHGALEQAVVALCIEQPLLVKACHLKLMIDIRCKDKVVLVLNKLQQVIIHGLWRFHITVEIDVSAPPRPEGFVIGEGIKPARVHIGNAVLLGKVGKVLIEPLSRIGQTCGS